MQCPQPPAVAWEVLADGRLLACALPDGEVVEVSSPAGELWQGVVDGTSLAELAQARAQLSGQSAAEVEAELVAFFGALSDRGLVPPRAVSGS